jgi:hypothetical protein
VAAKERAGRAQRPRLPRGACWGSIAPAIVGSVRVPAGADFVAAVREGCVP